MIISVKLLFIALDPANPLFYPTGCYLRSTDASWIDVIHTDKGGYGASKSMGTVEYNANSGARPQPGCKFGVPGSLGGNNIVIKYAIINSFLNKFCNTNF
jgi:hypothetical protein